MHIGRIQTRFLNLPNHLAYMNNELASANPIKRKNTEDGGFSPIVVNISDNPIPPMICGVVPGRYGATTPSHQSCGEKKRKGRLGIQKPASE